MNFIALISILLYACLEVKCDNQTDAVAAQLQFLINEERDLRKNLETRVQRLRNEAATINSTIGKGFVYFCDCSVIVAPHGVYTTAAEGQYLIQMKHGSISRWLLYYLSRSVVLVDSSVVIFWTSPFVILGVSGSFCRYYSIFEANNVHPDQTPHDVASDLGLHCLPMTLLRVSRK